MNHPFYKRIFSYLTEISIEKTRSPHNPWLEVRLVQGRHQLITKDAVYSFDDKYLNFHTTFKKFNWNKKINNVLVLGLGLASVIYILEKYFDKNYHYTAIEIDEEICRLAHKYTLRDLNSYVEVYPIDGEDFLKQNNQRFELIIMDIFQSAIIPGKFQNIEFLELLKDNLTPDGCILYNRMNITSSDKSQVSRFEKLFFKVFPGGTKLKIGENIVFVSNSSYIGT